MDVIPEAARRHYQGKRYIAYARCAYAGEAEPKLLDQILRIHAFGALLHMQCVGEVRLAGVNGRSPLFRDDLLDLLARKRRRDDFDVVMMMDFSRLTRESFDGGEEIEARFAELDVEIVFCNRVCEWDRRL